MPPHESAENYGKIDDFLEISVFSEGNGSEGRCSAPELRPLLFGRGARI